MLRGEQLSASCPPSLDLLGSADCASRARQVSKKNLGIGEVVNVGDVLSHMKHIYNKHGAECISIGSDFGGIVSGVVDGLESVESLPEFIRILQKDFVKPEDLDSILQDNAMRVIKAFFVN